MAITHKMKHSLIATAAILVLTGIGVLLFVFLFNGNLKYAPTVKLSNGYVRGFVEEVDDSQIYFYQGIRYGTANRFEKPRPVQPWDGVYEAIDPRDNCPQLGMSSEKFTSLTYSEDCLMLNIWRPIEEKSNRTVMVYIFGGGFSRGSIFEHLHDGRYIAHRGNVIVVTLNYRLGAFGFMFASDANAPANLGLHDQILGLQWVHENIQHFGGNPEAVTIFGNSAGSMCVSALLLSPLTKGLFQRAFIQSGVIFRTLQKEDSVFKAQALAKELQCDSSQSITSLVKECFKKKNVDEILNATQNLGRPFQPVNGDDLLPERSIDLLLNGNYNSNISLIYGVTRDEGSTTAVQAFPELDDDNLVLTTESTRGYIIKLIGEQFGSDAADFYLKRANLPANPSLNNFRHVIYSAIGDFSMTCPVILFSEQFIAPTLTTNRHFSWMLIRPAAVHVMGACKEEWDAVCHADELFYLFTIPKQSAKEDIQLSHEMIQAWTQFAKNGNPGKVGQVQWTEAMNGSAPETTSFLALDFSSKMVSGFYKDTCSDFWRPRIFV